MKKTLLYFLNPLGFKPLLVPTPFFAEVAVIYSQKELIFGIVFSSLNILIIKLFGNSLSYEFMSEQSPELLPNNPYKSLRIGLHDYMFNLTSFCNPKNVHRCFTDLLLPKLYFNPMWNLIFNCSFSSVASNTLLSLCRSFTVKNCLEKTNFPSFCFWLWIFLEK